MRLRDGSRAEPRFDNGLVAHRISGPRYVAGAVVDRSSLSGEEAAGLSAFGLSPFGVGSEALGISVQRARVTVWRRDRERVRTLARTRTPASGQVHLRLTADGNAYRFEMSPDGAVWRGVGGPAARPHRGVGAGGADQRRPARVAGAVRVGAAGGVAQRSRSAAPLRFPKRSRP